MIRYFALSERPDYTLADVTRFNDEVYPHRKPNEAYDRYRFANNPFAGDQKDFLYVAISGEKYVGQMLTMPAGITVNNQKIDIYWGQNYFVQDKFRKRGIGKKLIELSVGKEFYMAYGITSKSKNLHQSAGLRAITHIDFYWKWGSRFKQLKYAMNRRLSNARELKPKCYEFPQEVENFKRITSGAELNVPNIGWNPEIIETLRDKKFIDWRFFYKPDRYFMYAKNRSNDENSPYFVVRPTVHLNRYWLQVVDYRYSLRHNADFECFLRILEKLRKQLDFPGILIPSSLRSTHLVLEKKGFRAYRRRKVVTSYPFRHEESEKPHDHFMVSPADSDWDMHNRFGKFNFGD